MGYACPVCGVPQRDGEHLANHLAFTAMLRGADHAGWLDEHVPDWRERGPADLAPAAVEHAAEAEYETVFEDTVRDAGRGSGRGTGHDHEHGHGHGHDHDHGSAAGGIDVDAAAARGRGGGAADGATREALREARRLTREMYGEDEGGAEGDTSDTDDPDASGTDDPDPDGAAGG